jgi:multidrug efflux pump subunit AcrB
MATPDSHPATRGEDRHSPSHRDLGDPTSAERSASRLAAGILRYYRIFVLAVVALVLAGVGVFVDMPRTEDPEFQITLIRVYTLFPGALASKVESLVTRPIEDAVEELSGVESVTSQSLGGISFIEVEAEDDADPAELEDDIADKLKEIREELPDEAREPVVFGFSTGDIPVVLLALYGPEDYGVLRRWAELLDEELSALPDVAGVEIEGLPSRQIHVDVDSARLAQYGLSLLHLRDVLALENAAVPGGKLDVGARRFLLKNPNEYESLDAIRDTVVGSVGGGVVLLRDLAEVADGFEDDRYLVRSNGSRAALLGVVKRDRTNTIAVAEQVRAKLDDLRELLPPEVELRVINDRGEAVGDLLGSLQSNAISGGVILAIVVAFFLGTREAFIVCLSIPLSVLMAFIGMRAFGIDLNQVSIFGLVLALGNVVDASLVVVENIANNVRQGRPLQSAVALGTQEVATSVLNSTFTTVAAIAPLLFMTGDIGRFVAPLPLTLTFAMLASALVALTITPLLCYAVWKNVPLREDEPEKEWKILGHYVELAKLALRNRLVVVAIALVLFAGALFTIPRLGIQLFPKADKKLFVINVRLPREANFATTDLITRQVEQILGQNEAIRDYTVNVGRGSPAVHYSLERESEKPNFAQVVVNLDDDFSQSMQEWVGELQDQLQSISGAEIETRMMETGPVAGAPIQIRLAGDDLDTLVRLADEVKARIGDVPGVTSIRDDMGEKAPQLEIHLDKRKAGLVGVDAFSFSRTVYMALNGEVATELRTGDEEVPVQVRLDRRSLDEVSDLERLYLPSASGRIVPFGEVATLSELQDFAQINRRDGRRTVTVMADVRGRLASQVLPEIRARLDEVRAETGYTVELGGENEEVQESFGALLQALMVALLLIYALLAMQFNSFVQPLAILLTVPFGIVGAVFGLFVTGRSFGVTAFIGIIGLCGVVIADSILLADVANYLQRVRGMRMLEALVEASRSRVRPVLATMATTIAGLIPMAFFGGDLWSPLAVATIFGDLASTFLILVFMPVIYSLLVRQKEADRSFRLWRRLWQRLARSES